MLLNKRLFEFSELFHEFHLVDIQHNWKSRKGVDSDSALYLMMAMLLYDSELSFNFDHISTVSSAHHTILIGSAICGNVCL